MRALATFTVAATTALALAACGNDSNTPPPATPAAGAYPPGYPAPTAAGYPPPGYATAAPTYAPGYPPQPGYPAPAPTYAPQPAPGYPPAPAPAPMPTAPPAPTGTMATPGLLALPCSSDAICGLHHCNTQYSKCAFPCQTAVDCLAGNQCMMGVCVPGTGQ